MANVAVIGAGVIGVATAYVLCRQGHDVVVIERRARPCMEASFANAGLLTPSMSNPWNAPGSWTMLAGALGGDAPLQLRWRALPDLAFWGPEFLRQSSKRRFMANTVANLELARYSLAELARIRALESLEFGHSGRGVMKLFRDGAAFDAACASARRLKGNGLEFQPLTPAQAAEMEPALAPIAAQLAGAIHFPGDEAGDARLFGESLAARAQALGVRFRFNECVSSVETRTGRVNALITPVGRVEADQYVLAAGSGSRHLAKSRSVNLPVRPVKGYSLTFAAPKGSLPLIPLVDDHHHLAITPMGPKLRLAGVAEFAGDDLSLDERVIGRLIGQLGQILPDMQVDPRDARIWAGLRPMSVDGVPVIGRTPFANLWLNTGHGHLGWTMATGSAALLADLMAHRPTNIDAKRYALARFG